MAKKPSTPAVEEQENEETASESASSSEAEGEEEEVSSEEEEEEQNPPSSQLSSKTTPLPNPNPKNNSEEDSEDEEETDSDDELPPKTKSLEETLKSKPQPKPSPAPARSGTKRPAENNDTKQSNKKKTTVEEKKKKEPEEDNKKSGDDSKKLFQRVFTDDDEVVILQGLVDFTEKTGTDPCKYLTAFYEFVKKSIHVQVKLDQLKDKVRRLKVRYERRIKSGKTPTNLKPVDEKRFELSKKVWGGKVNEAEENGKVNGKPAKKEPAAKKARTTKKLVMEADSSLVVSKETRMVESGDGKEDIVLSLGLNETVCGEPVVDVLKRGMELIEESKRGELERRRKKLKVAELELFVQRSELVKDSASLILDALKSSSSY